MRTSSLLAATFLLAIGVARAANAQGPWSVMATGGAMAFSDAARLTVDGVDEAEAFSAASTTSLRIGVERDLGRFGVRFGYGYAEAGLGTSGTWKVIYSPALTLHELTLQAVYRLAGTPGNSMLTIRAGPLLQVWGGEAVDSRSRWGGQAGLTVDAPLVAHLTLIADLSLGMAGSFLEESDLDPLGASYETLTLRTTEFAAGLRYRF